MKTCSKTRTNLPLYAGGDLPWWRRRRVQRHLQQCAMCRVELAELSRSIAVVRRSVQVPPLPADDEAFWQAVARRLPEPDGTATEPAASQRRFAWRPLLYPALGFAVLVAVLLARQPEPVPRIEPPVAELLPLVEPVDAANTTTVVFQTSDPKIRVVWFFRE